MKADLSHPDAEGLALTFRWELSEREKSLNLSARSHLKSTKTLKSQIFFSPLPCLHSYLLFLRKCTLINVNSLQKDLCLSANVFIRYTKYIDEYIKKIYLISHSLCSSREVY